MVGCIFQEATHFIEVIKFVDKVLFMVFSHYSLNVHGISSDDLSLIVDIGNLNLLFIPQLTWLKVYHLY